MAINEENLKEKITILKLIKYCGDLTLGAAIWVLITIGGIGTLIYQCGYHVAVFQAASPREDISLPQLSPEQQSLLREIWRYQNQNNLDKVVIMHDAFIFDDTKKEKTTINLYSKVLKKYRGDAYRYEAQFEEVINSIPMVFLKRISETRYDNPYVVTITEKAKRLLD